MITREEHLRGVLLGGAVGDALGAPVEFMDRDEILATFGPRGITSFAPAYGRLGAITDDTQMTLFTLEGLMRAQMRFSAKGICHVPSVIDHAYRRWYATQARNPDQTGLDGWLITHEALWSRRAPGNTCLAAMAAKPNPFGDPAQNDSKGAGGIMRVAPIGIFANKPWKLASEVAGLTHGHPAAKASAAWFAQWISSLTAGGHDYKRGAEAAWSLVKGQSKELDDALGQAMKLAEQGPADLVPEALGEGWVGEEAAAIALWCVLVAPDPMEALRLAVNIDGDSDTTGTLVGQALGAALGDRWIPQHLLNELELRDVMVEMAADTERVFSDPDPSRDGDLWARYPGH